MTKNKPHDNLYKDFNCLKYLILACLFAFNYEVG